MAAPLVVIGTGLAGYNLVKEFRKLDAQTPIIMITSDDGRQYSKPMLSTGFTKGKSADDLAMADAGKMADTLGIEIRTHQSVTALHTDAHEIQLGEETIAYSQLVLAMGAAPIEIPLSGFEHLYHINDLMDYARFNQAAMATVASQVGQHKKRILVMGAGLVGCEYAHDMAGAGFEVILVSPDAYPLPRLLPEECGHALMPALTSLGVELRLGHAVVSVEKKGDGIVAVLDDGSVLEADMGLSAVGLSPRTDLAKAAGLACERGIQVDRMLQTSAQDVYALGDCAEVAGLNLLYVLPLMNCARALAKTLSGQATEIRYPVMPVQVKTPSLPIVVSPAANGVTGQWQISGQSPNLKAEFRGESGNLLGYALTGECVAEKMALNKELPPMLA